MSDTVKSAEAYNAEILSTLKRILAKVEAIESRMSAVGAAFSGSSSSGPNGRSGAGSVASDRDLDGQYGNPVIKFDPYGWNGESYVGCHFADAPPDYLDALADGFDRTAEKAEHGDDDKKRKNAKYKRLDAARARGWARRRRNGWEPPAGGNGGDYGAGDDDYGF